MRLKKIIAGHHYFLQESNENSPMHVTENLSKFYRFSVTEKKVPTQSSWIKKIYNSQISRVS